MSYAVYDAFTDILKWVEMFLLGVLLLTCILIYQCRQLISSQFFGQNYFAFHLYLLFIVTNQHKLKLGSRFLQIRVENPVFTQIMLEYQDFLFLTILHVYFI